MRVVVAEDHSRSVVKKILEFIIAGLFLVIGFMYDLHKLNQSNVFYHNLRTETEA